MASLIKTINQADQILLQYHRGETCFLVACERLADLGCYNITPKSYSVSGVELGVRR